MPAELVIARVTAGRAVRAGLVWAVAFAAYLAVSALGYVSTYPDALSRRLVAASLGSNAGINAIFGPARHIDTVAGFTEWRAVGVLSLVGAVWGLLLGTRLLRGEEDAGRWELLLAGRTTRRRAGAEAIAGFGVGALVLWAIPALVAVLVGTSSKVGFSVGGSLLLALTPVACAAVFLLVGALTSQLAATRRQAAAYAAAALAVAYTLRAVADARTDIGWLRWLAPLGWAEQVRPLTGADPVALLPVAAALAVLGGAAVHLAGRRDLGASALSDRTLARPATRLLGGVTGLTVRLVRPLALGWTLAVAGAGLVFGLVAKTAARAVEDSGGAVRREFAQLGAGGSGARAYLGVAFLVIAVLVALAAAASVAALRTEEAEGRLVHLVARPVARTAWLLGRVGTGAVVVTFAALLAATTAWLGAASQGAGVGFGVLFEAAVNVLPVAWLVLGIGILAFGLHPRAASATCYTLVAWSFLMLLVGSVLRANHWLLDTSLLKHLAAAPAVSPDWTSLAVLTALAMLCTAVGSTCFARRDLAGE